MPNTKTYCVTVARYGCIYIKAENEAAAMDIANHQRTDDITWFDDWDATNAKEDDTMNGYE